MSKASHQQEKAEREIRRLIEAIKAGCLAAP